MITIRRIVISYLSVSIYNKTMSKALFINMTATGASPMYSQITTLTTVEFTGDSFKRTDLVIDDLESERKALTDLCSMTRKADLVLYINHAAVKYISDCCRQYCLDFHPKDSDELYKHIDELVLDLDKAKSGIPAVRGEFKHFYKDYKNYYYLPAEDVAYHKSVSEFVDKSARRQATARTAYIKKTGLFAPVFDKSLFNPDFLFRPSYECKQEYLPFELLDLSDNRVLCSYIFCPHKDKDV